MSTVRIPLRSTSSNAINYINDTVKNNEQHLGIIRASSVCGETVQFSAPDLTATTLFASLVLPNFVTGSTFDFDALHTVTKMVVRNLDKLIDITEIVELDLSSCVSAKRTRALGIGVQGLADTFMSERNDSMLDQQLTDQSIVKTTSLPTEPTTTTNNNQPKQVK